jgi:hypothetical protein
MDATKTQVHQGKYGFYPCSHETFLKVKAFHWYTYLDLRATNRLKRWEARLPKNRQGSRPGEPLGTDNETYQWILAEYRNARHPAPTADSVKDLYLPRNWEQRFEILRGIYEDAPVGKFVNASENSAAA